MRTSCSMILPVNAQIPKSGVLMLSSPSQAHLPRRKAVLAVSAYEAQVRFLLRSCEAPRYTSAAAIRQAAGCCVPGLSVQNRGLHWEGESGTTQEYGGAQLQINYRSIDRLLNRSMDQYVKGEQLGKGTFGTVFKATHTQVSPCTCVRSKPDARRTASRVSLSGGTPFGNRSLTAT